MNCFSHNESSAIGVCRHCFKGVCPECSINFDDGVACSDYCLGKAKSAAQVVSNTVLAHRGAKKGRFIGPSFLMVLGAFYMAYAVHCDELFAFTGALGLVFLVLGAITFVYNKKYFRPIDEPKPNNSSK